jgi:hypothetical protein
MGYRIRPYGRSNSAGSLPILKLVPLSWLADLPVRRTALVFTGFPARKAPTPSGVVAWDGSGRA